MSIFSQSISIFFSSLIWYLQSDSTVAVSGINQFFNSPTQEHWEAVIWIIKYIRSVLGKGLIYEERRHTQKDTSMPIGLARPVIHTPHLGIVFLLEGT